MAKIWRNLAAIITAFTMMAGAGIARADTLDIPPVIQQTPVWCWAAASEMVLLYYGFPNLNPAGNYQCGVVGSAAPTCSVNCALCVTSGGTTYNIARIMGGYAYFAQRFTGYVPNELFQPRAAGRLSAASIRRHIDAEAPILAGITPSRIYPPGMGFSQHAVVIVGYEEGDDESDPLLVINDPYLYPGYSDPYVAAGGDSDGSGQHTISYRAFVNQLGYDNSIVFR